MRTIEQVERELSECQSDYHRMSSQAESDIAQVAQSVRLSVKLAIRDDVSDLATMIQLVIDGKRDAKHLTSMMQRLQSSISEVLG